ncbi:T9SS-dependent choice-of-anchor J family protein [Flavobacterium soli]|uniref:T9SS-dependent choice-of-anchor J family protein n=1 Tax=Flavobacterium soli TaxID=344881 RepID=UPI000428892A|nr:choice-of-anchor J domain-containing protein [Flavobacterium soli]
MKKITLLSAFLFLIMWGSQAQCIRTSLYPFQPYVSNNLGLPETVTSGAYSSEYSQVINLTIGTDYVFTCIQNTNNTEKYITVTDYSNEVIAYGASPLTVEAITTNQIRLHYSDNADCASTGSGHTVTLMALLDCSPPLDVSVSNITTTNATFEWQPQGDETAWQVLVLPNGSTAPTAETEGTDVTNDPTYTHTTLTAAGNFKFYVRANCGSEFSPWSSPLNFASGCDPITSFSENFDSVPTNTIPICWYQIKNGSGSSPNSLVTVMNFSAYSPANVMYLYSENTGSEANLIVATPQLANLSAGTHRLKLFARSSDPSQSIQFGTVNNTTADAEFTLLDAITVTDTYQEYAIDYTVYEGTDSFVAIRHNGSQFTSVLIDDVRWEVAPLCADVTQVTIPAETITTETATINWIANSDETLWDVVYGPTTVNDPTTLTPISPAPTTNPATTLTGLTPNTSYNVWVRSICGENIGGWIGPKTFKTACIPSSTINESFDNYAYSQIPDCWSVVKNGEGVSQYSSAFVTDYNFYSPSRTFMLGNSDSASTGNIMLVSPELLNIADGTHRLKFYAKSGGATGSLEVGTVDTNTNDAVFIDIETISITSTYTEYVVEFTDTAITDSYFAFRFNTPGTYNNIFIDNVVWEPIPSCADVTDITVPTTTVNTATVNWISNGDETEWDVVYDLATVTDPTTLTPIDPAPTSNTEATLTGLSENTSYKVWVRSVCGGENGAWIGPITFKTPCIAVTSFDENVNSTAVGVLPDCWSAVKNGTGISEYATCNVIDYYFNSPSRTIVLNNAGSTDEANILLVSPSLGNLSAGTHRVKFFARSGGATGSVQVGTVDNTSNDAVFSELETVAITSTYAEYIVNFTDYSGEDTFIAFRHNISGAYTTVYIDDIRWEVAPLCADVTNIAVAEITTETANITWEPQGTEANWQVAFGPATTTDPEMLTPSELLTVTSFPLSDLTENTSYKFWVRSACGEPNGNGIWMGPIEFTTQCLPTTVPFTQNFETATTPALPSCSLSENTGGNPWGTTTVTQYGFNSKVLQYIYTCSSAANAWYYTQGIALTAGQEYTISYKYGTNNTLYVEKLKVMFGMSPTSEDMTEEIANHDNINFNIAQTNETLFTAPETGVYFFGFNVYSASCQYNLYVDDITIEAALSNPDFNSANFKFYPNPVKDVLNLSYDQAITNVAVFNLLGQKVIENTINATTAQVDMSNLATGSYLVKVTSENQTKTIKVIKE